MRQQRTLRERIEERIARKRRDDVFLPREFRDLGGEDQVLRVLRIRTTQWALLTGQLVWWTPFLIVALKGLLDVDAYKVFDTAYLLGNLAVGLAIIPLAIWVSRRFADRMGHSPLMQRLMRELAGYNLNAATGFLAKLSEFENETRD